MTTTPAHGDAEQTPKALEDLVPSGMCVAMVTTMVGREHSSRPVTVAETVANDAHSAYLSLNGTAIVSQDTADAARLWSKPAGLWFDGPADPNLAVLHFDVSEGHYWDGPDGMVGRVVAMARAAITSNDEALGTSGPVAT